MQLIIKIAMNEIVLDPEFTATYNHLCYKFTGRTLFGFTHVVEKYDDVNDNPIYEFRGQKGPCAFVHLASGCGDPIPAGQLGFSRVYVEVTLESPNF
jgi:hypothetical protein